MSKDDLPPLNIADPVPFQFSLKEGDLSHTFILGRTGQGMTVVYPTATFAESAGFASWAEAVEAMRAGKIVRGRGPSMSGKTTFDVQLFIQAVADAGMRMQYLDMGIVAVGLPDQFKD